MRNLLTSWAVVAGAGCITAGFAMFSHALGFVVGGAALVAVAMSERHA